MLVPVSVEMVWWGLTRILPWVWRGSIDGEEIERLGDIDEVKEEGLCDIHVEQSMDAAGIVNQDCHIEEQLEMASEIVGSDDEMEADNNSFDELHWDSLESEGWLVVLHKTVPNGQYYQQLTS